MDNILLNEQRCKCGKLLLKGTFFNGVLEIKCTRCGQINKIGSVQITSDAQQYLLITNSQGLVVNVSDSIESILGYSRGELIGQHFTKVNPTMPREMDDKFFGPGSVLSEENFFQLDTTHQAKSGQKIPVSVSLKLYSPNDQEKCVMVLVKLKDPAVMADISSADDLKFLDKGCDFYFVLDKNGICESISPSVEKLFGFTPETVVGKSYFDHVPPQAKAEIKDNFAYFSAREEPYRIKHDIGRDAAGRTIYNELYFTPNFNDFGKFSGYCVLGWVLPE